MSSVGAPYEFLYKVEIPVFWAESKGNKCISKESEILMDD